MQSRSFRLIALAQLLGVALLVAAQVAAAAQGFRFTLPYLTGVILVGGLTLAAGLLLLRGHALGRRLSLLVQALQVLGVSTAAFSYQVALGPVARLRVHPTGWLTQFGAYGNVALAPGPLATPSPEYSINFLALLVCVLLVRSRVAQRATVGTVAPAG